MKEKNQPDLPGKEKVTHHQNFPDWHMLTVEDLYRELQTRPTGLSEEVAASRLLTYGPNQLQEFQRISPWTILWEQFRNILIIVLLVATVISAFLGHGTEAIVITVIVLFAVLLGFVQEYRAERAMEALRKIAAPQALVIRAGIEYEVPAHQLVPGDVVLLQAGNRVPADLRLTSAVNLQIEESPLTGESVAAEKHHGPIKQTLLPVSDRRNMAYAGTTVSYGRGRGVVTATAMDTEFGRIAQLLQTVESSRTPLQDNLDKIGRSLARIGLVVIILIVALGLWRGQPFLEMFIFGIALAVAVVPEALPAVVTISLAIGVQRMVKRNALVRRLPAVETLGSTSVICSDKTGTLTRDEMTVRKIWEADQLWEVTGTGYDIVGEFLLNAQPTPPSKVLELLLQVGASACDAHLMKPASDQPWSLKGDSTEGALVVAAAKAGFDKPDLEQKRPRIGEIPFSSEKKRMTTLHDSPDGPVAYAKGAPEVIIASCKQLATEDGPVTIDNNRRNEILQIAQQLADEALRVLGVAYKPNARLDDAEEEMIFLGLVGMIDPPRPEVEKAVRQCEQAGIQVKMITGDHPLTAQAIARELSILRKGKVLTGVELDMLSEEALAQQVEAIEVFARVSPMHKIRVVSALQQKGFIVAMTGDGINDAPALKKADIGIAMGITGTDVSKEAAAMTLTDDNFASIVAAVEEGRGIFGNIKKYLMYLLSSNIGEILLMAGASLMGLPLPLSAVQILYVNLATDGLPALALAVDPPEPDLMGRPPRKPSVGVFSRPVIILMIAGGVWSAVVNLGVFVYALNSGLPLEKAMSLTFISLVLIQFFKAYNFRSDRHSAFRRPFSNRWLNLAILWEIILLLFILYLPLLQGVFATYGFSWEEWISLILITFTVSPLLELFKWMERRGWFGRMD